MNSPCFACCLNKAPDQTTADLGFVMGIAHSIERGIIETQRSLCPFHMTALRTFGDSYAEVRRKTGT